ncbi:hypothetical protein HON52_02535 [Candidatus Uhrbacteria bacterium]|nr:hypothetical protein [Candidatus Uhrbacteria bacterium]MBT6254053.1 hypothetical protein [Candidatus Uhrbacteria bacterium]
MTTSGLKPCWHDPRYDLLKLATMTAAWGPRLPGIALYALPKTINGLDPEDVLAVEKACFKDGLSGMSGIESCWSNKPGLETIVPIHELQGSRRITILRIQGRLIRIPTFFKMGGATLSADPIWTQS